MMIGLCTYMLADATIIISGATLRGAGDTRWVMVTSVSLHWLMLVLLVAVYLAMELHENFPKGSDARAFMKALHFMLGISVLILMAARIAAAAAVPGVLVGHKAGQNGHLGEP